MENKEHIKKIFYDYAQGIEWLEISKSDLDIIAERIEREVMGIESDNFYANLKDISKTK